MTIYLWNRGLTCKVKLSETIRTIETGSAIQITSEELAAFNKVNKNSNLVFTNRLPEEVKIIDNSKTEKIKEEKTKDSDINKKK